MLTNRKEYSRALAYRSLDFTSGPVRQQLRQLSPKLLANLAASHLPRIKS